MKYIINDSNKKELGLEYSNITHEEENICEEWDISPFFPEMLKELVDRFKGSQAGLAKFVGKGKSSINNYMDGSSIPNKELLIKMAEYFSLDSNYFFVKVSGTHPNFAMREVDNQSFPSLDIPIINNVSPSYRNKDFLAPENYIGIFSAPPSVQAYLGYHKSKFFAVSLDFESISDANATRGALAIFYETAELNDGDLAVIFLKEEQMVLVRRVRYDDNRIIFSSDQSTDAFDSPAQNNEFRILGKVVAINQCTYFR